MSRSGSKTSEQIEIIATGKDGKVKQRVVVGGFAGLKTAAKNVHFCSECGNELSEVPLLLCEKCGERFVARVEPKTGKTIIFTLGKQPQSADDVV